MQLLERMKGLEKSIPSTLNFNGADKPIHIVLLQMLDEVCCEQRWTLAQELCAGLRHGVLGRC